MTPISLATRSYVAREALSERDCLRANLAGETDYSAIHVGGSEHSKEPAADLFQLARERRCELRTLSRRGHRHGGARLRVRVVVARAGAERVLHVRDYFVQLGHVQPGGRSGSGRLCGRGRGKSRYLVQLQNGPGIRLR